MDEEAPPEAKKGVGLVKTKAGADFEKINKQESFLGKSYDLYKKGKWKYVNVDGKFVTLGTMRKRDGRAPY